ncbi:cytochrome c oxidase assembly protein [Lipingzhangella rawalii]
MTSQDIGAIVRIALVSLGTCFGALILALYLGGVLTAEPIAALPDAGPVTQWGLPISKQVLNLASVATVGLLLLAVFLLPSDRGVLAHRSETYVRAASWAALVWMLAAVATLVFQMSDLQAVPVLDVLGDQLTSYASSVPPGVALMVVILVTTAIALLARTTGSAGGALGLLALALFALMPPPLTGHASSSPFHELAISAVALHVIAIALWVGGLGALLYHGLRWHDDAEAHVPTAVQRYSRMALWAYIGVGVSGLASAASRLYGVQDLVSGSYGLLILAKALLFVLLGYLGWLHRTRTVPEISSGRSAAFLRLAAVEVAVMAAVLGLSVALTRVETPEPPEAYTADAMRAVLGFPMPPEPTWETMLTLWRPDLFFATLVVVAGGLYAAGVVRLFRRGDRWPWGRTISWFLGLLTIVAVKLTGVATYSVVLFSTHMIQHMVLSMLTPMLLVLGGPATLALRALRPAQRRGDRGPREWITVLLHSSGAYYLTHPLFVVPLFVLSTYGLYFTPLFGALMLDHIGHMAMSVHFLLVGYLFYWIIIGVDPLPTRMPHLMRILVLLVTMALHAFFGVAIMSLAQPLGMEWYGIFASDIPWLDDDGGVLEDQQSGGGIAWGLGEVPTLFVMLALLFQWRKDEERKERRRERHSKRGGSDDADMDAYNAYLARLNRQAGQDGR